MTTTGFNFRTGQRIRIEMRWHPPESRFSLNESIEKLVHVNGFAAIGHQRNDAASHFFEK